jgi:hypothetical protein
MAARQRSRPSFVKSWVANTHGSEFELVRHFLSELLANDLIGSDQVRRFVITVLAVVGCIGPLIVRLYVPKYGYLQNLDTGDLYVAAVRADRLFLISLSMLVAGLVTVIQWHGLFPSRLDYLALKPLPVRLYQVFVARFLSCFLIVSVVIADLNLATSVLFPFLTSGRWQSPSFGIRYMLAHASATFCAGLFAFFTICAVQGLLMSIPPRVFERASVVIQALLATALVATAPYVLQIPDGHELIAARPRWVTLFPPAWFLGLYETLLGARDSYFVRLRETAVMGLALTLFVALTAYFFCYRRHASRVLEQALPRSRRVSLLERFAAARLGIFLKHVPERAAFVFALLTLRRSRRHKFVLGFSIAIALMFTLQTAGPNSVAHFRSGESWSAGELESILAIPLVMSAVLISALCYVFQLPSEVHAGWVFRIAESTGRRELLDSVEDLLILSGVVPVLLLTAPILVLLLGWGLAIAHMALAGVLMLLLIEMRLYEWHKIPFTCSYVPGRRNLWQTMGSYLLLFAALIPTITYFEARLRPFVLLVSAAALGAVYFPLRSARLIRWRLVPLLFDELDEPLIAAVRLNRE